MTDTEKPADGSEERTTSPARIRANVRPPIEYSSPKAFAKSFAARWRSVWTRRFTLSLIAGQLVSLCITCTSVTTTELVNRGWLLSTTQNFFTYFSLFIAYTPYTIYKYGFSGWGKLILKDGIKYFFLAACDVEANFLAVYAFQYTDLLSCMLLDAWAIPVCMTLSWVYLRVRYHWTQILGVFVCVVGLGLLVASDRLSEHKTFDALDRAKGDGFMIAAATLYGITNATEELFVRKRPLYEVVGQIGMWGLIISSVQATLLERHKIPLAPWGGDIIGLLMAFTVAMLILYTLAPLLYRLASSAYFNLSLLSSDFYGLLFGLFLYRYRPYWLYFISFVVIISGLITYFWYSTPEEQGILDPKPPPYLETRSSQTAQEHKEDEKVEETKVPGTEEKV